MNIVGVDRPAPRPRKAYHVMSHEHLLSVSKNTKYPPDYPPPPALVPILPIKLPPAPPMPTSFPPALTEADLRTYIRPLIANGWVIGSISQFSQRQEDRALLKYEPSLHRAYHFTDYSSARHFLHTAVAAIPAPRAGSLVRCFPPASDKCRDSSPSPSQTGVDIKLGFTLTPGFLHKVSFWLISELAPDARRKYGISLADVHFAINLENEVSQNWVGRANTGSFHYRWVPKTMDELWNFNDRKWTVDNS